MTGRLTISLAVATLLVSSSALANDGVLEINQACATSSGCFPGDAAGFPVTISAASGGASFRLTGDLSVPDENTTAISISGVRASIDLNGFAITGTTNCTLDASFVVACAPVGSGVGIQESGGAVAVKNGVIARMGGDGIRAGNFCVVRETLIAANGGSGVAAGFECLIENNQISVNRVDGISLIGSHADVGAGTTPQEGGVSRVRGNTFTNNGRDGVAVEVVSQIENNLFTANDRYGLNGFAVITYSGNLFSGNVAGQVNGPALVNTGGNHCQGAGVAGAACP